jgi:two-component system, NarL family, sensor histidine kinase DesK
MKSLLSIVEPVVHPREEGTVRSLRIVAGLTLGLLFLTAPMNDLARSSLPAPRLIGNAVGLALFVVLYIAVMRPRTGKPLGPRTTLVALAVLAALAAGTLAAGAPDSFDALFVFFAAAVGMRLRAVPALVVITLAAVATGVVGALRDEGGGAMGAKVLTVAAIGLMMVAFNRQIRANRELRAARESLSRLAVSEERLRIARDVHDLLGHSLSVIALKSELAARLLRQDAGKAAAELADVQAVTRNALAEVREAVQGYRQLGLADALAGARSALAAAGIECELDEPPTALPADVESVLAWAVREGTTNVVRHSSAAHCAVRFAGEGGRAVVEVEDDGSAAAHAAGGGSGLAGLAERAERVRGRLEAGAQPGGGFTLRVTVPLPA